MEVRGTGNRYFERVLLGGVLFAAFVVRLVPLGRYVTPDESIWVFRSIRFADALVARDWAAVPVTGHPGVTTMWLGAAAISVQRLLSPVGSQAHLDWVRRLPWLAPENGVAFPHLAYFLSGGRIAVAAVTTLGLLGLHLLLRRLVGPQVALVGVGLLAFDPFFVGHSGLLHTDALLATFTLLALTAALCGRYAVWGWPVSGAFTALALLTKTPAVVLLGFVLVICAVETWEAAGKSAASYRPRVVLYLRSCVVWGGLYLLVMSVTLVVLYPALWPDPLRVIRILGSYIGQNMRTTSDPVMFLGRVTYDPGPAFYALVLPFRTAPLTLIGLGIGVARWRRLSRESRRMILFLLGFAFLQGLTLTLGAKKYDRYLLPILCTLTVAAVIAAQSLAERYRCKIVLLQVLLLLPVVAYPLTGFNPLFGGQWGAKYVLDVDWGEGMGAAARWLNRQPGAERMRVAAISVPSFAPLFVGQAVPLSQASLSDYIVAGPASKTPPEKVMAYRVAINGLVHATVYTNTAPFEQAAYLASRVRPGDVIVLDADLPLARRYSGPGQVITASELPDVASVLHLTEALDPETASVWLVSDPVATPVVQTLIREVLEGAGVAVEHTTVGGATITCYRLRAGDRPDVEFVTALFGERLRLLAAVFPERAVQGAVPIALRWQTLGPLSDDMYASLYLRDAAGHRWAEVGGLIVNSYILPTSHWEPGSWADTDWTLVLPALLPPGTYRVELTVTSGDGSQVGAWDAGGRFRGVRFRLGNVMVAPPSTPSGVIECVTDAIAVGPFQACLEAVKGKPLTVLSGDWFTVEMLWSAVQLPGQDYLVRWRLLDGESRPAQEEVRPLSPYPTSRWRVGDSFAARYSIHIDPSLPAGRYSLTLNVLDPKGKPVWPEEYLVTTVDVGARLREFVLPTEIAHPLNCRLGDVIHLRGFELACVGMTGDTCVIHPGDVLPLILYWQADGPTEVNYTVFVHLVGPDGRVYGQIDRMPLEGAAPTSSWAPGQVITDSMVLAVAPGAPAGLYHVVVGLYDVETGERLQVIDARGQRLPDEQVPLPFNLVLAESQG